MVAGSAGSGERCSRRAVESDIGIFELTGADGVSGIRERMTRWRRRIIEGLVLDRDMRRGRLLLAGGGGRFVVKKEQPLLNWGNAWSGPRETRGLDPPGAVWSTARRRRQPGAGAVIRQAGIGYSGGRTRGRRMVAKEFPLRTGTNCGSQTARIEVVRRCCCHRRCETGYSS